MKLVSFILEKNLSSKQLQCASIGMNVKYTRNVIKYYYFNCVSNRIIETRYK